MMKLEPNQWVEEFLVRGELLPDGSRRVRGAHVVIGTLHETNVFTATHPVAVLKGEAGVSIADVVGQLVIGLGVQIDALKGEVEQHKAKTLEAHEHLHRERQDHAETKKRVEDAHRQLRRMQHRIASPAAQT